MRYVASMALLYSFLTVCFSGAAADMDAGLASDQMCGIRCVGVASALLGLETKPAELLTFRHPTADGLSLYDVKELALHIGLNAQGRRLSWQQLTALDTPAIIAIDHHFVVIDPRSARRAAEEINLKLFDPPHVSQWVGESDLKAWKGDALLLSRSQAYGQPGAHIDYKSRFDDFGSTTSQGIVYRRFPFSNSGVFPLHIMHVSMSCGCTEANTDKAWYGPGEHGNLLVQVDLAGKRGRQHQSISIITNDQKSTISTIVLEGLIMSPLVASREEVDFGEMNPGDVATETLIVLDRGDGKARLSLKDVAFLSKPATGQFPKLTALSEKSAQANTTMPLKLVLAIPHEAKPGEEIQGMAHITTNYAEYPELEIGFRYRVAMPLELTAQNVSFGKIGSRLKVKTIGIRRGASASLNELSVKVFGPNGTQKPSATLVNTTDGPELKLELPGRVAMPSKASLVHGWAEVRDPALSAVIKVNWSYIL